MAMVPMPAGEDIEIGGDRITFGVRRCPDGSAVFAMTERTVPDAPAYALQVVPEAVMVLIEFLLNRPTEVRN